MKRAILLRQRPGLGDMALLAPTVKALREKRGFEHVVVVTDESYIFGALRDTALMVPGVDDVMCVPMLERTTPENRHYDRTLGGSAPDLVEFMRDFFDEPGDEVFDLNTAFLKHEWAWEGQPPHVKPVRYGIAEFWLRHLDLWEDGMDALPRLDVPEAVQAQVDADFDLAEDDRPLLGIVLRAGDPRRDWDDGGYTRTKSILTWAHSNGYRAVTIDRERTVYDPHTVACVGRSMPYVAAVIARCRCVLTPDTGLMHVAQAVGTPTVSLWGVVDPRLRTMGYRTIRVPQRPTPDSSRPGDYSDLRRIPLGETLDGITRVMSMPTPA